MPGTRPGEIGWNHGELPRRGAVRELAGYEKVIHDYRCAIPRDLRWNDRVSKGAWTESEALHSASTRSP